MNRVLGCVVSVAAVTLMGCGTDTSSTVGSSNSEPSPAATSSALSGDGFVYEDPDAAYATRIGKWEAKANSEKGEYAASLAAEEGWRGNNIAVVDVAVDTCLNLAKYQDGTYTAFYAWTYILNDIARANDEVSRTKQALVASYFVGATCPELGDVMTEALEEAFESVGGL